MYPFICLAISTSIIRQRAFSDAEYKICKILNFMNKIISKIILTVFLKQNKNNS